MDLDDLVKAPLRVACRDHVAGVGAQESFGGELTDGLQQPEAPTVRTGLGDEHRPLDQIRQQVIDLVRLQVVSGSNARGRRKVEWSGEYRKSLKYHLLRWRQ